MASPSAAPGRGAGRKHGPARPAAGGAGPEGRPSRGGPPARGPKQPAAGPRAPRQGRADPVRRAACDVLCAVAERDAYANLLLPAILAQRGLSGRDAALATELTYGTLRGQGTYDAVLAICSDRGLDRLDVAVREILRLGTHQLLATRVAPHAAVATSVDLVRDIVGQRAAGFVNAILRRVATRDLEAWLEIAAPSRAEDIVGHLAVRYSHPRWIVGALSDALGETGAGSGPASDARPGPGPAAAGVASAAGTDAAVLPETEAVLAADNERPKVTLCAVPGLADRADLAEWGASPARWSEFGAYLREGDPARIPAVASARAGAQDEASQLAAIALTRVPVTGGDSRWLDLCAGPGGKARLLAGLAARSGARLVAAELRPHRARLVQSALSGWEPGDPEASSPDAARPGAGRPDAARPGAATPDGAGRGAAGATAAGPAAGGGSPAGVVIADGTRPAWARGAFDRVIADVPCSGLGALQRRPEARWRRSPETVSGLHRLQRRLLRTALDSVRPGGVVAFVTCTPHLSETRAVLDDVLPGRTDIEILDAPEILAEVPGLACPGPDSRYAQFWPHRHGTDAIFIALLRRHPAL